jgi:hypothetical protein
LRVRETRKLHAAELETEMLGRGMMFEVIESDAAVREMMGGLSCGHLNEMGRKE